MHGKCIRYTMQFATCTCRYYSGQVNHWRSTGITNFTYEKYLTNVNVTSKKSFALKRCVDAKWWLNMIMQWTAVLLSKSSPTLQWTIIEFTWAENTTYFFIKIFLLTYFNHVDRMIFVINYKGLVIYLFNISANKLRFEENLVALLTSSIHFQESEI